MSAVDFLVTAVRLVGEGVDTLLDGTAVSINGPCDIVVLATESVTIRWQDSSMSGNTTLVVSNTTWC
jgi:hypothetical protein